MPIKFTPKSEDDFNNPGESKFQDLPPGEYPFTVLESDEVPSKSSANKGRLMFKLKLNVHGPNYDRHVYDQFADWFSEWKLKHFLETTGFGKEYLEGKADASNNNWEGRKGYAKIIVEPARGGYESRNAVKDYLPDDTQKVEHQNDEPSDVPF